MERRELIKDKALTCTYISVMMGYLKCLNDLKINRKRLKLENYTNRGSDSQDVIIINVECYFQIRKQFS